MRRMLIVLGALLAALALVGAGCGGGDEESAEPPAAEPAPAGEPAGGATTLEVAADPDGALAYDTAELAAPAGDVTIVLTNDSELPHNVALEDSGGSVLVEGEIFSGGGTRETSASLEAGTYTFFCSVPGHREAGMEGTLAVG